MRAVAAARRRAVVVVNAAEGEPASLQGPHADAERCRIWCSTARMLAAQALGADELIVCVCESAEASVESVRAGDRGTPGAAGGLAAHAPDGVPEHYVAGQESALVNHLNGGPAMPTFTPPMAFRAGRPAPPDAGQQRRDARPRRADRPSRARVVSRARHALPARVDARHAVRARRPSRASTRSSTARRWPR